MNYLPLLTDDEVRYICSVIPYEYTIAYFTQNPKKLAKIRPGFRAKAISKSDSVQLLFNYRNHDFISYFIEKHISDWLFQIKEDITERLNDGDSKELAVIHTLPFCFFSDDVRLYYKLINEEHSEEHIAFMSAAVKAIKEATSEQENLIDQLKTKDLDIKKLQDEIESAKIELERNKGKLNQQLYEIETLQVGIADLKKLRITIEKSEHRIISLEDSIRKHKGTIKKLKVELSGVNSNKQKLKEQIKVELEKLQAIKFAEHHSVSAKPKCPCDIDEFKEFLDYNLKNLGVAANSEYYPLLKDHLSEILFQGIPILVNRVTGIELIKCVANTIIGKSNVKTLVWGNAVSAIEANQFLSSGNRIVCLDNFIGNFNETELIPLFDMHKDKIVFLTVPYDGTVCYVAREFMHYCHYLNLNRITAMSGDATLTEDPSKIDEIEYIPQQKPTDRNYSNLGRDILRELGFSQILTEQKSAVISNEQCLCRLLAFDILPYCVDVLKVAPFNTSERLVNYAGDSGRCQYKKLFKEWFM